MLSNTEKALLNSLILRLQNTKPLSKTAAVKLREASFSQFFGKILNQGSTFGEASGHLSFLSRPDSKEYLKSIQNDLLRQIEIVNETLDFWFQKGFSPAPNYMNRIAVILRKRKDFDMEKQYLSALALQFYGSAGRTWEIIDARIDKIEATPPPNLRPPLHHT